jgi:hypothetical protein
MAEIIELGVVGIKNCGEYNSETNYEKLNVVTYQGSSYCALKDTVGNLPTDTEYWQLYAAKGDPAYFDNVASMKSSTNLTNGNYAKTLGYYTINDDGGALYKIRNKTNEDTIDEMFIISLDNENLIAELITNYEINLSQLGIKGDGETDETLKIQTALDYAITNNKKIIGTKHYKISSTINIYDLNNDYQKTNVELNEIIYSESSNAIKISTNAAVIKINKITGDNSGTAVLLSHTSSPLISHNIIEIGRIKGFDIGLHLKPASSSNGIQYNIINGLFYQSCNNGIVIDASTSNSWVNQNYFNNMRLDGVNGIKLIGNSSAGSCNGNAFTNVGLENISGRGIELTKAKNNHFRNIRNIEGLTGDYWFYADNDSPHNTIEFTGYTVPDKLYSMASINIFKNGLYTSQGFPITQSEFTMQYNQFDLKDNKYNTNNQITVYNSSRDLSDTQYYKLFDINKVYTIGNELANTNVNMKLNKIIENYTQFYLRVAYVNASGGATVSISKSDNTEIFAPGTLTSGNIYLIKQLPSGTWTALQLN